MFDFFLFCSLLTLSAVISRAFFLSKFDVAAELLCGLSCHSLNDFHYRCLFMIVFFSSSSSSSLLLSFCPSTKQQSQLFCLSRSVVGPITSFIFFFKYWFILDEYFKRKQYTKQTLFHWKFSLISSLYDFSSMVLYLCKIHSWFECCREASLYFCWLKCKSVFAIFFPLKKKIQCDDESHKCQFSSKEFD